MMLESVPGMFGQQLDCKAVELHVVEVSTADPLAADSFRKCQAPYVAINALTPNLCQMLSQNSNFNVSSPSRRLSVYLRP